MSGVLSFEVKQKIVSEGDGSIEVCVQSFLIDGSNKGLNHFHLYTLNLDAEGKVSTNTLKTSN